MDWMALQYRAEKDSVKMMRAHRLCIFILVRSGCNPPAQTIMEQLNLLWTWSLCAARQAKLCQALLWTWPWPPQALRLCTYGLPQHDSYWKTWGHFVFHPEFGGHWNLWLFSSLQFQRRIIGAFLHKSYKVISSLFHLLCDFFSCVMCYQPTANPWWVSSCAGFWTQQFFLRDCSMWEAPTRCLWLGAAICASLMWLLSHEKLYILIVLQKCFISLKTPEALL